MSIKKDLEELKEYCYKYIERQYGIKQEYIKRTKMTKNGLFIYGHKCYAPGYSMYYDVFTFISWIDANNYSFITDMLDNFVLDCKRLRKV